MNQSAKEGQVGGGASLPPQNESLALSIIEFQFTLGVIRRRGDGRQFDERRGRVGPTAIFGGSVRRNSEPAFAKMRQTFMQLARVGSFQSVKSAREFAPIAGNIASSQHPGKCLTVELKSG